MKTYRGTHGGWGGVTVDGRPLPPRLDLRNHTAQLALAILCDHLGDDVEADDLYQAFKWRMVATLRAGVWTLTTDDIERALSEIRRERLRGADLSPHEVPF